MKHIRKGRKPAALAKFERDNVATPQVVAYVALPSDVRRALTKRMLKEQGRLCAYTMRRIGEIGASDFHVEHIRPQRRQPELQLDYANIVLCSPGEDKSRCDWGATYKKDALVDDSNFLSPLRADCETRLIYRLDGTVREASENDPAAKSTIGLLNLNHRELVAERVAALRAFGLGEGAARPLSGKAAERLSQHICQSNAEGDFEPFCVAIRQAAERLAAKALKRSARLRIAR